jgi:TM2 domain-containing membrane protein YozV
MKKLGSAGNVIAAIASFFVPGLGQLCQGRLVGAAMHFGCFCILWFFWLGWLAHIYSAFSAAIHESEKD